MIRKMRLFVFAALAIMISVSSNAEENFELLKGKQIRAKVVGKGYQQWCSLSGVLPQGRRPHQHRHGYAADRHLENPGRQTL